MRWVVRQVAAQRPDIAVHLGDIYYKGLQREAKDYLIAPLVASGLVPKTPVFIMPGNHEMMSGGHGYFWALKELGRGQPDALRQRASFFCLRGRFFQIIGLDTAYFEDARLVGEGNPQPRWLAERLAEGRRDKLLTILLTQHAPYDYLKQVHELHRDVRAAAGKWFPRSRCGRGATSTTRR